MAGYCTLVLYFYSPAARENTATHSCNIQPYCLLTHQIIYIYNYSYFHINLSQTGQSFSSITKLRFNLTHSSEKQLSGEELWSREDHYTDPADKVQVCSWETYSLTLLHLLGTGYIYCGLAKSAYRQSTIQAYQ